MIETNPPAIVRPASEKKHAELAKEINELNRKARKRLRMTLNDFRQIGIKLIRAKERPGMHGNWLAWIYNHLDFSDRTARLYIQIARHWKELKLARIANLTEAAEWLNHDHGKESEPLLRQAGDEPEELDESPLEITTSKGRPIGGVGEKKFSWKSLLTRIDKARRVPSEIVQAHKVEQSSVDYQKAVKLLNEAQKVILEWHARMTSVRIEKPLR